jgi:hypothetical protein
MDLENLFILVMIGAVAITLLLPLFLACMGEKNIFGAWWLTMRIYFSVMLFLFVAGVWFGTSMHHATGHMYDSLPSSWEWVDQVNGWLDDNVRPTIQNLFK